MMPLQAYPPRPGSAEPHFFRPAGSNASMPIQRQDPRMQQGSGGMLQTYLSNNSYTAGHQGLSQGANYGMRSMDGSIRSITAASPRFPPTSYNTGTPNPFHQGGNSMASDLRRPNSSQGSYSNYQPQLAASGTAAQSRSSYLSAQYSSYTTPRPTSRSGTPVQDYSTISGSFRASGAQSAASYHDHARGDVSGRTTPTSMSSSYSAADLQPRRVPAQHPPPSASHNMRRAGEIYKTPYYQTPPPASPTAKPRPRPESPSVLEVKVKDGEAVGGGGVGGGGSVLTESAETRRRQQLLQNLKDKRQQERQEHEVDVGVVELKEQARKLKQDLEDSQEENRALKAAARFNLQRVEERIEAVTKERDALKQMDEQKSRKIDELNKRVVDLTQTLRSQEDAARRAERERMAAMSGSSDLERDMMDTKHKLDAALRRCKSLEETNEMMQREYSSELQQMRMEVMALANGT